MCVCAVLFVCLLYNLSLYMVMSLLFMLSILYVCNAYISIHYAVKHMGGRCMVNYVCNVVLYVLNTGYVSEHY